MDDVIAWKCLLCGNTSHDIGDAVVACRNCSALICKWDIVVQWIRVAQILQTCNQHHV